MLPDIKVEFDWVFSVSSKNLKHSGKTFLARELVRSTQSDSAI